MRKFHYKTLGFNITIKTLDLIKKIKLAEIGDLVRYKPSDLVQFELGPNEKGIVHTQEECNEGETKLKYILDKNSEMYDSVELDQINKYEGELFGILVRNIIIPIEKFYPDFDLKNILNYALFTFGKEEIYEEQFEGKKIFIIPKSFVVSKLLLEYSKKENLIKSPAVKNLLESVMFNCRLHEGITFITDKLMVCFMDNYENVIDIEESNLFKQIKNFLKIKLHEYDINNYMSVETILIPKDIAVETFLS